MTNKSNVPLQALNETRALQSIADRDGMLQGGMEEGFNDSHDRLDELLEKMKKR